MRVPPTAALLLVGKESSRLRYLFQLEVEECLHPCPVQLIDEHLFLIPRHKANASLPSITSLQATLDSIFPNICANPEQLLCSLSELALQTDQWDIECECVHLYEPGDTGRERVSPKMLLCSIAQTIQGSVALYPYRSKMRFHLIESRSGYFLGTNFNPSFSDRSKTAMQEWKRRPYSFSAAVSVELSDAVISILIHRFRRQNCSAVTADLTFLDPCCGSGTTLFSAHRAGLLRLTGFDISQAAVDGAKKNLGYVDILGPGVTVERRDSSLAWSPPLDVDIVVANLPWGENKFEYVGENSKIIQAVGRLVHGNSQVALITHSEIDTATLKSASLQASRVVPIDQDSSSNNKRAGKCYVSFCTKLDPGAGLQRVDRAGAGDDSIVEISS